MSRLDESLGGHHATQAPRALNPAQALRTFFAGSPASPASFNLQPHRPMSSRILQSQARETSQYSGRLVFGKVLQHVSRS